MNHSSSVKNSTFCSICSTSKQQIQPPLTHIHTHDLTFCVYLGENAPVFAAETLPLCCSVSLVPWPLPSGVTRACAKKYGVSVCRTHARGAYSVCECVSVCVCDFVFVCHLGGLIVGSAYTISPLLFFCGWETNEREENTDKHVNWWTQEVVITYLKLINI